MQKNAVESIGDELTRLRVVCIARAGSTREIKDFHRRIFDDYRLAGSEINHLKKQMIVPPVGDAKKENEIMTLYNTMKKLVEKLKDDYETLENDCGKYT